jgi:AcrR family transcriptional regulator
MSPGQRAPRANLEERRAMIVRAAIPLLVELGPAVTTLQIARAAGISEPTIFRAFEDKTELLGACLADVVDPRNVEAELQAIDPELALPDRLAALIDALRAQGERSGAVITAVRGGGGRPRGRESVSDEDRARLSDSRTRSFDRMREAIAEVLAPDTERLRKTPAEVATLVLAVVLSLGRGGRDTGPATVRTADLTDLLLNGIAA